MRRFFHRRIPPIERILLVESGSRSVLETLLPRVQSAFGAHIDIDLVTCYTGLPEGFPPAGRVFRVSEYAGRSGRRRLYRELRGLGYSLLGIICSGEPIMNKWKWALALQIPAKVFIVNENADFFWFDYGQRRVMLKFALVRSGWGGAGAVRTAASIAAFPFTLAFLLLYAAAVHSRRLLRLFVRAFATPK